MTKNKTLNNNQDSVQKPEIIKRQIMIYTDARMVWKIDMNRMPSKQAEKYLKSIIHKYKKKIHYER